MLEILTYAINSVKTVRVLDLSSTSTQHHHRNLEPWIVFYTRGTVCHKCRFIRILRHIGIPRKFNDEYSACDGGDALFARDNKLSSELVSRLVYLPFVIHGDLVLCWCASVATVCCQVVVHVDQSDGS